MANDAHEKLVNDVARAIWRVMFPEVEWDAAGRKYSRHKLDCIAYARPSVALIAERTKEASPEMVQSWARNPALVSRAHIDGAEADWSAMHAASALWPARSGTVEKAR
jgi:hypothetical protein